MLVFTIIHLYSKYSTFGFTNTHRHFGNLRNRTSKAVKDKIKIINLTMEAMTKLEKLDIFKFPPFSSIENVMKRRIDNINHKCKKHEEELRLNGNF